MPCRFPIGRWSILGQNWEKSGELLCAASGQWPDWWAGAAWTPTNFELSARWPTDLPVATGQRALGNLWASNFYLNRLTATARLGRCNRPGTEHILGGEWKVGRRCKNFNSALKLQRQLSNAQAKLARNSPPSRLIFWVVTIALCKKIVAFHLWCFVTPEMFNIQNIALWGKQQSFHYGLAHDFANI